jgi:hypothetical protein
LIKKSGGVPVKGIRVVKFDQNREFSAALIADLYEAAIVPDSHAKLPQILAQVGGGTAGAVCTFGPMFMEGVTFNAPAEAVPLYETHFSALDPWTNYTRTNARNGYLPAIVGRQILAEEQLVKTEYFRDFAQPFELAEVIGGAVPLGRGKISVFSTHRPWRARLLAFPIGSAA